MLKAVHKQICDNLVGFLQQNDMSDSQLQKLRNTVQLANYAVQLLVLVKELTPAYRGIGASIVTETSFYANQIYKIINQFETFIGTEMPFEKLQNDALDFALCDPEYQCRDAILLSSLSNFPFVVLPQSQIQLGRFYCDSLIIQTKKGLNYQKNDIVAEQLLKEMNQQINYFLVKQQKTKEMQIDVYGSIIYVFSKNFCIQLLVKSKRNSEFITGTEYDKKRGNDFQADYVKLSFELLYISCPDQQIQKAVNIIHYEYNNYINEQNEDVLLQQRDNYLVSIIFYLNYLISQQLYIQFQSVQQEKIPDCFIFKNQNAENLVWRQECKKFQNFDKFDTKPVVAVLFRAPDLLSNYNTDTCNQILQNELQLKGFYFASTISVNFSPQFRESCKDLKTITTINNQSKETSLNELPTNNKFLVSYFRIEYNQQSYGLQQIGTGISIKFDDFDQFCQKNYSLLLKFKYQKIFNDQPQHDNIRTQQSTIYITGQLRLILNISLQTIKYQFFYLTEDITSVINQLLNILENVSFQQLLLTCGCQNQNELIIKLQQICQVYLQFKQFCLNYSITNNNIKIFTNQIIYYVNNNIQIEFNCNNINLVVQIKTEVLKIDFKLSKQNVNQQVNDLIDNNYDQFKEVLNKLQFTIQNQQLQYQDYVVLNDIDKLKNKFIIVVQLVNQFKLTNCQQQVLKFKQQLKINEQLYEFTLKYHSQDNLMTLKLMSNNSIYFSLQSKFINSQFNINQTGQFLANIFQVILNQNRINFNIQISDNMLLIEIKFNQSLQINNKTITQNNGAYVVDRIADYYNKLPQTLQKLSLVTISINLVKQEINITNNNDYIKNFIIQYTESMKMERNEKKQLKLHTFCNSKNSQLFEISQRVIDIQLQLKLKQSNNQFQQIIILAKQKAYIITLQYFQIQLQAAPQLRFNVDQELQHLQESCNLQKISKLQIGDYIIEDELVKHKGVE